MYTRGHMYKIIKPRFKILLLQKEQTLYIIYSVYTRFPKGGPLHLHPKIEIFLGGKVCYDFIIPHFALHIVGMTRSANYFACILNFVTHTLYQLVKLWIQGM